MKSSICGHFCKISEVGLPICFCLVSNIIFSTWAFNSGSLISDKLLASGDILPVSTLTLSPLITLSHQVCSLFSKVITKFFPLLSSSIVHIKLSESIAPKSSPSIIGSLPLMATFNFFVPFNFHIFSSDFFW